jgi:hypothetical protein
MNAFFAMVVQLAKHFKDRPAVLMMILTMVSAVVLILYGKLQGTITLGIG